MKEVEEEREREETNVKLPDKYGAGVKIRRPLESTLDCEDEKDIS